MTKPVHLNMAGIDATWRRRLIRSSVLVLIASALTWFSALALAVWAGLTPATEPQTSFTLPQIEKLPTNATVVAESSGLGVRKRSLRVSTHQYDDSGVLRYWYDGEWVVSINAPFFEAENFDITWVEAGFPFFAIHGGDFEASPNYVSGGKREGFLHGAVPMGAGAGVTTTLPFRPQWQGSVLNTAFFFLVLNVAIGVVRVGRFVVRRTRSRCTRCGYPAGSSTVCTECGDDRTASRKRLPV